MGYGGIERAAVPATALPVWRSKRPPAVAIVAGICVAAAAVTMVIRPPTAGTLALVENPGALSSAAVGSSSNTSYAIHSQDIEKHTWAASNASAFYEWALAHLPVYPSTDSADSSCGRFGRVSLCLESTCNESFAADFGLHVVNASARPAAPLSVERVEASFAAAFSSGRYAALMEHTMALWAPEGLDAYYARFGCASAAASCFTMEWRGEDDERTAHFSLFVLAPSTQVRGPEHASQLTNNAS